MFYSFMRVVARVVLFIVNGNARYQNREQLIDGPYILVGPHRTWWDPLYFALGASPRKFSFMAKEELFKNPILRFILRHANAFPVNRKNPGPSAVKTPVKYLRKGDLSLIMFPSGTRYSDQLKGGAVVIAKLAKVPLIPTVYQGPLTLKGMFKRQRVTVRFGEPIYVDTKLKMTEENIDVINQQMLTAFDKLDQEINPSFKYVPDHEKELAEKEKGEL